MKLTLIVNRFGTLHPVALAAAGLTLLGSGAGLDYFAALPQPSLWFMVPLTMAILLTLVMGCIALLGALLCVTFSPHWPSGG